MFRAAWLLWPLLVSASLSIADESARPPNARPQWLGALTSITNVTRALLLEKQRKYAEAEPLYREAFKIYADEFGERHPNTTPIAELLANNLRAQGKYTEALPLLEKVLDQYRQSYGEVHFETAKSYNNLATVLLKTHEYQRAEPLLRKALEIERQLHRDTHSEIAAIYGNLASCLWHVGKLAEAQVTYQRALDLSRELLGENNLQTAACYNGLAITLRAQGKYGEALPILERTVHIAREVAGEKSLDAATCYHNLAFCLKSQGKYVEAEFFFQKALELRQELLGARNPGVAEVCLNYAACLSDQEKYQQSEPLLKSVIEIGLETSGGHDIDTARANGRLAIDLAQQGKFTAAEPFARSAMELSRKLFGDQHTDTAASYHNLARSLAGQDQHAAARQMEENALNVLRGLSGDAHACHVVCYISLANLSSAEGNYSESRSLLKGAAASYEAARLSVAETGLERALFGLSQSPYPALAVIEVRLGNAVQAWSAIEANHARGLLDEAAARERASFFRDEAAESAALKARIGDLQPPIFELLAKPAPSDADAQRLRCLKEERQILESQLVELAATASQRQLATLAELQSSMRPSEALLLWADVFDSHLKYDEHFACLIRHAGDPVWEPMPGSGPSSSWTKSDRDLPQDLARAIAKNAAGEDLEQLIDKVRTQRIAPIEKYLGGIDRLYVIPVNAMAGVPLEVLTARYTISYAPSGTFLARLKDRAMPSSEGLLAVGAPSFPAVSDRPFPLPPAGLLLLQILPGSNAFGARLRANDVLLRYAGVELTSVDQLGKLIAEHAHDRTITALVWRAGETVERDLQPGKLGVVIDRQPAPAAIAAKHKTDDDLSTLIRGNFKHLPGTAAEVDRLRAIAADIKPTVLTRSLASEQRLEEFRASGKLAEFRYLHFATHGEPNNARSFESALILSQDQISEDIPLGGGKYYDGKLTANEVLKNWRLNAELVTLSACESALGRPGGGDGLLGFAQAFLLAGARAVCLSLWKVDDTATCLLMDRFYQNLLGKREGLTQPMGKAAALAEAKQWLRNLSRDEAKQLAADITAGVARGNNEPALKLVVPTAEPQARAADDDRPFAHPRYWAAFILIGDPD
jgi:tetratricopeptide (TPR) repeat protein